MLNLIEKVLAEYQAKIQSISTDNRFSQAYKNEQIQKLHTDREKAIRDAVPALRRATVRAALAAEGLQARVTVLREEAAANVDYARLNYEAQAAKSALVMAGKDFYKLSAAWDAVKNSGDPYKVRAWLDTIPANLPDSKDGKASGQDNLLQDMQATPEPLVSTSDDYQKACSELKKQMAELSDAGQIAGSIDAELGLSRQRGYTSLGLRDRVFEGISFQDKKIALDFDHSQITPTSTLDYDDRVYRELETARTGKIAELNKFYSDGSWGFQLDPVLDPIPQD